ncbi:MAG: hypothetical protein J5J06_13675 [Phycisphaerae bacterium]|nr:hypothetical protein [Phycisphaerae bacterium]
MPSKHVLDTCCFINFYASGQAGPLLNAVGGSVAIPESVKREALYLAAPHPDEKPMPINIEQVIAELRLVVVSPESEPEFDLYVELAADLDDGEAMGLAIAKQRGLVLMTDERKARARALALGVDVLTTCDVVAAWAAHASAEEVAESIRRIGRLARYSPGSKEPLYDWWMKASSAA